MLTETSIEGSRSTARSWLDSNDRRHPAAPRKKACRCSGLIWWPLLDQLDWDGAMTHRIGKIHEVGLFGLHREQPDGTLKRTLHAADQQFRDWQCRLGDERVGPLTSSSRSAGRDGRRANRRCRSALSRGTSSRAPPPVPYERPRHPRRPRHGPEGRKPSLRRRHPDGDASGATDKSTDRYGIVVFSHLRWGFVWQRPQQFLSRFRQEAHRCCSSKSRSSIARRGEKPELQFHRVMRTSPSPARTWRRKLGSAIPSCR